MVKRSLRVGFGLIFLLSLAACSLPRGSAISSEIIDQKNSAEQTIQVVEVTRSKLDILQSWPMTGDAHPYSWPSAGSGDQTPVIRSGDLMRIQVWDSEQNSLLVPNGTNRSDIADAIVAPNGTIFVPYVGEVAVAGMTVQAARQKLQTNLEPISPSVQVQLARKAGQLNSVDLVSGFPSPGTYEIEERRTNILSVIAKAGGVSPDMRNPLVRLMRDGKNYEVRADSLFQDAQKNIYLKGRDQIVVEPDSRFFTAFGASGREDLVYFDRDKITALESLSMIGGLADDRADLKGVLLLREFESAQIRTDDQGPNKEQVVFVFDISTADGLFAARNFTLNPQDTVIISESPVTSVRTVFSLIGAVLGIQGQL